jgi:hypothetical protein
VVVEPVGVELLVAIVAGMGFEAAISLGRGTRFATPIGPVGDEVGVREGARVNDLLDFFPAPRVAVVGGFDNGDGNELVGRILFVDCGQMFFRAGTGVRGDG